MAETGAKKTALTIRASACRRPGRRGSPRPTPNHPAFRIELTPGALTAPLKVDYPAAFG